jgi:hypothetical protein
MASIVPAPSLWLVINKLCPLFGTRPFRQFVIDECYSVLLTKTNGPKWHLHFSSARGKFIKDDIYITSNIMKLIFGRIY